MILMVTVTTALTTARNDGRTAGHKKQKNVKRQIMTLPPVISSGGAMLYGSTVKIATASRSPEIFLVFGNTGFLSEIRSYNTVIVIFLGDLSTLSHIRFLRLSSPRRLPPLEMTGKGWSHRHDYGIPENAPSRPHVISSGGSMLYDSTAKIATASTSREIFLVFGNTWLFTPASAL